MGMKGFNIGALMVTYTIFFGGGFLITSTV